MYVVPPGFGDSPVVLFVHQVVACAEGHEPGVVGGSRDGDGARAAHVCMAQLVGENLELVSGEAIVVPQHVVMRRSAGALTHRTNSLESFAFLPKCFLARGATNYHHHHHYYIHLNSCMAAQVEVKLEGVCDAGVDCGPCWNVATFPNLEKNKNNKKCFSKLRTALVF